MGQACGGNKERSKGLIRILVLGISGSGKSTFSKQMKILFTAGFNEDERQSYVSITRSNVLVGIKELAEQAATRGLEVEEKNRKYIRYFRENNVFELDLADKTVLKKVKALWGDAAIQEAWEACRNYQIQVSQLDYLMDHLERITDNDFSPNNNDIVRARQRTAGAYSTRFDAFKYSWEIIDVGGQSPERKKWHKIVQEGFASIIYFASLDEYNMESSEVQGKTKMEVSLGVFKSIMEDAANFKACTILFLTKLDLFKEKILSDDGKKEFNKKFPDFKKWLPDYEPTKDPNSKYFNIESEEDKLIYGAVKHIENQFREYIPEDHTNLVVFPSCTIDTDQMKIVFESMKDHIFIERMKVSGIRF